MLPRTGGDERDGDASQGAKRLPAQDLEVRMAAADEKQMRHAASMPARRSGARRAASDEADFVEGRKSP